MPVSNPVKRVDARCRIYSNNGADPFLLYRRWGFYETAEQVAEQGSYDYAGSGVANLEWLNGVGFVCRAVPVLQDTELAEWADRSGSWAEERPPTAPLKYRLFHSSAAPDQVFYATSSFQAPANQSHCFSLNVLATPSNHDTTTYPPRVRIEIGTRWALEWSKVYGNHLLRNIAGTWTAVMEIPELVAPGNSDVGECLVYWRVHRGRILVSTDRGRTYAGHVLPVNGLGVSEDVPAGQITVRGQGGQVVFGLHQLAFAEGQFTSLPRQLDRPRLLAAATPSFAGSRYAEPGGTSVTITDATDMPSLLAAYTATLTPVTSNTGGPFLWHRSPELYAVRMVFPPVASTPTGVWTEPYEGRLRSVGVTKPVELDGASAGIEAQVPHPAGGYTHEFLARWAFVEIDLADVDWDDNVGPYTTVFAGHVAAETADWSEFGLTSVSLELDNQSARFKTKQWTKRESVPLGGQTVIEAVGEVLESEGLNVLGYISRYFTGLFFPSDLLLPPGLPEDPFEWPSPAETKWETIQRLYSYAGLQLVPADDGTYAEMPIDWVEPAPSHTWHAQQPTTARELVQRLKMTRNHRESATFVEVDGEDDYGRPVDAWIEDSAAERNPLDPRFSNLGRVVYQDSVSGRCTAAVLAGKVLALAREKFPSKYEPDLSVPADHNILRRQRGTVEGGEPVGISPADEHKVMTISHQWQPDAGPETVTQAGLERIE